MFLTIKTYLQTVCLWLTELFQIELFFDIKTVFTLNWIVIYNCLNSLKKNVFDN